MGEFDSEKDVASYEPPRTSGGGHARINSCRQTSMVSGSQKTCLGIAPEFCLCWQQFTTTGDYKTNL